MARPCQLLNALAMHFSMQNIIYAQPFLNLNPSWPTQLTLQSMELDRARAYHQVFVVLCIPIYSISTQASHLELRIKARFHLTCSQLLYTM